MCEKIIRNVVYKSVLAAPSRFPLHTYASSQFYKVTEAKRNVCAAVVFSKNTSNTMDESLASILLQIYGVLKTLLKTMYARPPSDQNIIKRRVRLSLSSFHIHDLLAFSKTIRFIHVILFPPESKYGFISTCEDCSLSLQVTYRVPQRIEYTNDVE